MRLFPGYNGTQETAPNQGDAISTEAETPRRQ